MGPGAGCGALCGTKNNSAVSPNGVGYRLIKAGRDTRLETAVLGEVVAALRGGLHTGSVVGHGGGPDPEAGTGSYAE